MRREERESLMEAVLGHVQHVVELLAVSQTHCAREWDHHTMLRALKWAQHCERIHARSCSNPALRSALESRLRDTNLRLQDTVASYCPVMLSELAQCQHTLLVNLLRNPSAPPSIIQVFFSNPKAAEQGIEMDPTRLIMCKAALNVLCCSLDGSGCSGLKVETQVRGKLLAKSLGSIVTGAGSGARSLLDSVLGDSAGKTERPYDLIIAALLAGDDVTSDAILDWLQGRDGCLSKLCSSMSSKLCSVLSQNSGTFKRGYWDVLKRWASCLEYDVMQRAWVATCSVTPEELVPFNALVDRFRAFLKSGSPLKEETESELTALKMQSGDFDVEGLSVWTDLIIQLKTAEHSE